MNWIFSHREPQVVATKYWTDLGGKIRIWEAKLTEPWNCEPYPVEFASCYWIEEKGPVPILPPFYQVHSWLAASV